MAVIGREDMDEDDDGLYIDISDEFY